MGGWLEGEGGSMGGRLEGEGGSMGGRLEGEGEVWVGGWRERGVWVGGWGGGGEIYFSIMDCLAILGR